MSPDVPAVAQRDREATRVALEAWAGKPVRDVRGPEATGYSHETVIFEAGGETLVARVEPTTHDVFLDATFAHEYRVMRAVAGAVRVPRIVAYEEDASYLGAPFFVMEHVAGAIPSDNPPYTFGGWLAEASEAEQARAWWSGLEAMAEVHRLDVAALGLSFLRHGVRAELDYAARMLAWTAGDDGLPAAAEALAWLRATLPEEPDVPALCWGDSRLGNQVFRDFCCVALLDWEMAAVADPVADLGWFLYFDRVFSEGLGVARPAGFGSREDAVARYEELTGRAVRRLMWFEVFAAVRFAIVMHRLGTLMKMVGRLPPDSDFGTNNFAVDTLARLLGELR